MTPLKVLVAMALIGTVMGDTKNLLEACHPTNDKCEDGSGTLALACDKATELCVPKVDQSCTTSNQFCVTGASCVSGVCKCGAAYTASNGLCTTTTAALAGVDCNDDADCTATTMTCSSDGKACACAPGYSLAVATGLCTEITEAKVAAACGTCGTNAQCTGEFCTCEAGYYGNPGEDCTAITTGKIGAACDTNPCGDNATCPTTSGSQFCECNTGYYGVTGQACGVAATKVSSICTITNPKGVGYERGSCSDINSLCSANTGGTCVCKTNYYHKTSDNTCEVNPNTKDGKCTLPLGGTDGDQGSCLSSNAKCSKGICSCKSGYFTSSGSDVCQMKVGNLNCTSSTVCVDNAVCDSTTKKCKCSTGYTDSSGTCTIAEGYLGGACSSTAPACKDANAACTNSECSCNNGFKESGFSCKLKVGSQGQDCTSSGITCVDYASCDSSSTECKCNSDFTTTTGNECEPKAGTVLGACFSSDVKPLPQGSCEDSNANCTSGTCYCNSGYTGDPNGDCKKDDSDDSDDSGAANVVLSFLVMAASLLAALTKY